MSYGRFCLSLYPTFSSSRNWDDGGVVFLALGINRFVRAMSDGFNSSLCTEHTITHSRKNESGTGLNDEKNIKLASEKLDLLLTLGKLTLYLSKYI